jgi:cytochrome c-type biogenesis protein CcmE
MTPRRKRFAIAGGVLVAVGAVVGLILNAFQSNLVFFYSPSQVAQHEAPAGRAFRIGGMVEKGTLERDGTNIRFVVTDTAESVPVRYVGILPDLFKEGKGVVAQGRLENGVFVAKEILAKHDENYMPPEATEALKRAQQGRDQKLAETLVPSATAPDIRAKGTN